MTTNNDLFQVVYTEAELAEMIFQLMKRQQDAIVHCNEDEVLELVHRQQSLMQPLSELEKERLVLEDSTHEVLNDSELQQQRKRLKDIMQKIIDINRQNKVLIENSLRFVRQSLRILTDNYSRNLIDSKV